MRYMSLAVTIGAANDEAVERGQGGALKIV